MTYLRLVKRDIPLLILIVFGMITIADYYIAGLPSWWTDGVNFLNSTAVILSALAVGLGLINLTRGYIDAIMKRTPGRWYFSLWAIVLLYSMIGIGVFLTSKSSTYQWIYLMAYTNPVIGMGTLYGFYVLGAMFLTFKVRNLDTVTLTVIAILQMLAKAPITDAMSPIFSQISLWVESYLNTAGARAWIIVAGIGLTAASVSILTGRESKALGGGDE